MIPLPILSSYEPEAQKENFRRVTLESPNGEHFSLWFSYDTLVAFSHGTERHVIQNRWGSTTGKHLNLIDGGAKSSRLPDATFHEVYSREFANWMRRGVRTG